MPWHRLCPLDAIAPGEIRPVEAGGTPMLLVRGTGGYVVIPPSCPHMANPLAEGFFDGCVLTCNKHLWQWSIPDGRPLGDAEKALLAYETEERGGEIWVNFEGALAYGHECGG